MATENHTASERQHTPLGRFQARTIRMLALVDLANALPKGEPDLPAKGESTDREDKLEALLHSLQFDLEAQHAEVSNV